MRKKMAYPLKALILNYGQGMTGLMLEARHVDGGGLNKDKIQAMFLGRAVRIAYSQHVPGLIVAHYFDEPIDAGSVLSYIKCYHHKQTPRKLVQRVLIEAIIRNASTYGIPSNPWAVEKDCYHLSAVPKPGVNFEWRDGPAPANHQVLA